jgi:signal transduction histidine kinase
MHRLRAEIADYRKVTFEVLAAYEADHSTPASRLLDEWIAPRRAAAIAVSDELRALNGRALLEHQIATADIHRAEEHVWWRRIGFALATTIGIAVLAVLYAGRLEDRLRRERDKNALHAQDLQQLSTRLVAVQEEERRTIARELHDEVGQVLSAIAVEAQLAERALPQKDEAVRALGEVQQLADGAIRVVRDLSHLLRPTMLDDLGLGAAIDWLLRGTARRYGVHVDLVQSGTPEPIAPNVEVAAFRIVQEAVTNVARHAHASRCTVGLGYQDGALSLTVDDDGVGFDVSAGSRSDGRRGLGLVGIRERVLSLGGTFIVDSREGHGTSLRVTLPLEPADAAGHAATRADRPVGLEVPSVAHG